MEPSSKTSDFHPSEEELETWLLKPKLFVSERTLQKPLPATLSDECARLWREEILNGGDQLKFISDYVFGVASSSMLAASRYVSVKKMVSEQPDFPLFTILLAECQFLLNDSYGAYLLAKQAQDQLSMTDNPDADLEKTIAFLAKAAETEMAEPNEEEIEAIKSEGITIRIYERPADWLSGSEPFVPGELQLRWEKLQQLTDGREMFVRCACIQSNELEGVFCLDGDSEKMLTRCGFFLSSIEGISHESRTKNPEKVVMILENTQRCYNMIASAVENPSLLTLDFLKRAHAILLENDNLEVDTIGGFAHIVPLGRFRATPCYTCHEAEEVHFCPAPQLEKEMTWFIQVAQQIVTEEEGLDPFRAAAWIHHTFVRIHPFADGNGRMARIISSLPLLKAGLPPIFVASESKKKYFESLEAADEENDVDLLARFSQTQVFTALEKVLEYNGHQDTSIQSVPTGITTASSTADNSVVSDNEPSS